MTSSGPEASITDIYAGKVMPGALERSFPCLGEVFPTRTIGRGGEVAAFTYAARPLGDFPILSRGETFDLYDYVSRNRVAGLLVMHADEVVLEHYELGSGPNARWPSMSIAKSISSTLVGIAVKDGLIGGLEDQLADYLPNLADTAYGPVTIRNLLQMTSGVGWDERPTEATSDRRRMLILQQQQQPGAIMALMGSLPRVAEQGAVWNYSTGETHVVGALLRAVTGQWLADYLSEKLWRRLGMESDATWWLESPGGLEVAGSGINATLRDYARFARFVLLGGRLGDVEMLPEGWLEDGGAPRMVGGQQVDYGYMWWPVADADGSYADKAFGARGLFGQMLYVNPAKDVLIAVNSARSKPRFAEAVLDNDFFNAAVQALGR